MTSKPSVALALLLAAAVYGSDDRALSIPAAPAAGMYCLSRAGGTPVYLSWLQPQPVSGVELLFSRLEATGRWSNPRVIVRDRRLFSNYADHPSIEVLPNGSLVAHWLVRNPGAKGPYGTGLEVSMSTDGGRTWRTLYRAGISNIEDYTGFVSVLPVEKGFMTAYLAPPDVAVGEHIKTLRVAMFDAHGKTVSDDVIDADVCTCCPTATTMTPDGPVVAYRDHRANQIRDISIGRQMNGRWQEPQTVSADGWQINGCPTDGPALFSHGSDLGVAWFTRAHDIPQVKVAFSSDSGRQFTPALRVDGGNPIGRVDLQFTDNQDAIVSWIERTASRNEICLRRVSRSGRMSAIQTSGASAEGRAAGFPKTRIVGKNVLLVWKADRLTYRFVKIPEY